MARAYRRMLGDRHAIAYIVPSWMFADIAGSPLTFIDALPTSTTLFAVLLACTGCGIVVGATPNGKLSQRGVGIKWLLLGAVITAAYCTSTRSSQ